MSSYAFPFSPPCSRPIAPPSVGGCRGCRFGVKESDLTETVTDSLSVSYHPLHSLAMSEQMTASALVRNDRFDSLLNHFNRFSQGQEP